MSRRVIIARRHLARMRANRSIAIGLAFGVVILLMLSIALYAAPTATPLGASELAFATQRRLWGAGSFYNLLVLVLAIVLGSSMVNDDVKAGTIIGVLARPVSRADYFTGSLSAAAALVVAVELMRCGMSIGVGFTLEGRVSAIFLVATIAVLAGDLLRLATFAALGAVFSTGVAVFIGVSSILVESFAFVPKVPSWIAYPLRAIAIFLPLSATPEGVIGKSLVGAARETAPLFEIVAYRLCWTTALLLAGIWAFQRREIAPRI